MEWLTDVTVGEVVLSFFTCCLIHETLVIVLPDEIAGPGGWLIDTRD